MTVPQQFQEPQFVFGLLYSFAYFAMLFGVMAGIFTVPDRNSLFSGIVGGLTLAQGQIIGWFFRMPGAKQ